MSTNPADVSYLQIFSLTDLISAPLIATVQGDFYAAERFVTYLRMYGFEPSDPDKPWDWGKLRMVTFQYRMQDKWMEMQIPLISLIPLPLLSVSDADFRYNLRILGLIGNPAANTSRDPMDHLPSPLGAPVEPKKIQGSFAPLHPQTENVDETPTLVANMDIRIRMRQSDLPAGIATMLNVVQSAVEGTVRNRIDIVPAVATLADKAPSVELRTALIDYNGIPLANYMVNISAGPMENTTYLLSPEVVEGILVSEPGKFPLNVRTTAAGVLVIRWRRGIAPAKQIDVTITASAEVDFPGNQFGSVNATAILQVLPPI